MCPSLRKKRIVVKDTERDVIGYGAASKKMDHP